jgi:hypothetical protein
MCGSLSHADKEQHNKCTTEGRWCRYKLSSFSMLFLFAAMAVVPDLARNFVNIKGYQNEI